jgi:hypothetical protein
VDKSRQRSAGWWHTTQTQRWSINSRNAVFNKQLDAYVASQKRSRPTSAATARPSNHCTGLSIAPLTCSCRLLHGWVCQHFFALRLSRSLTLLMDAIRALRGRTRVEQVPFVADGTTTVVVSTPLRVRASLQQIVVTACRRSRKQQCI